MLSVVVANFIFPVIIFAQSSTNFNQRDDEYRMLGLKRAKAAFEMADMDFKRIEKLYKEGFISEQEFIQSKQRRSDTEVNYQQSLLAVIFEDQYVSVDKAVKHQKTDGSKRVSLTLQNTSGGAEFDKLVEIEDELFRALQPDVVNDIYVSLLNNDGAIISQPYEFKIEELRYGHPQTIDFELLQDVDMVTVNIVFSNGKQRSPKIYLQKDNSANRVVFQSEQFAQEVELGGAATFDLNLELFSGLENTFRLDVANLPRSINRYFQDATTNARLSQIKFSERSNSRPAQLRVFLPERPTENVKIDTSLSFFVIAIPRNFDGKSPNWREKKWTEAELQKLNIGYARLEINPRGIGQLLVRAQQLFFNTTSSSPVEATIEITNEGSRSLNNVQVETDLPFNWRKNIEPQVIPFLDIGEEQIIKLTFLPPEDISPGRYEIRIRTRSLSDDQPVDGEDKNLTIEVEGTANIFGTLSLVLLIVIVIAGMVIFGIKLTRR